MTLAHEVSASGGLRVLSGRSEGQVQKQHIQQRQSPTHADSMKQVQLDNSLEMDTQHSIQQFNDVSTQQSMTRDVLSSQKIPNHLKTDYSTLLATAKVNVNSAHGSCTARVLIDPGSELTLITSQLVNLLRLKRQHQIINIRGVGSSKLTQTSGVVICELQSTTDNHRVQIRAHIMKQLTATIPKAPCNHPNDDWPHLNGLQLADPSFNLPQSTDILLGADFYGQIIRPEIIYHSESAPIAQSSIFGWLILGPVVPNSHDNHFRIHHAVKNSNHEEIQQLLTKFWVQEEVPLTDQQLLSQAEQQNEEFFKSTHSRHSSGRYIVRIPLISSPSSLGESYTTAYRCLRRQLRRLNNDSEYSKLYREFMTEYEQLGHMRATPQDNQHSQSYFLPHHGVLRPTSTTTKLRVVFNGSSPSTTGTSLNDITHTGAKIQLDIFDVLLWVRQHQYVFATDITKMYRQIMVHPDDWNLQQILWIDTHNNIIPYQLKTVTYGTRSAPFLAVRVLLQLVEDEGHQYPRATQAIIKGRYVDDIFGGADSPDELVQVANELIDLCKKGGFPLAKWQSNSQSLLQETSQPSVNQQKITFEDCTTKILGLQWNPSSDTFTFASKSANHESTYSKRLILSEVAQIYDPLGFVSPLTIRAKMLLQELWLHNLSWDEPVPQQIIKRWLLIREEFTQLNEITIPRWIHTSRHSSAEIHGFSDASQLAMAATLYLKIYSPSTTPEITLICAKTKVAPIKQLTIPRLELTAALILAKLTNYVRATLTGVNITSIHLWTDSSITLSWINSNAARWKDFVRNRVVQIQELVPEAQWRHIPGKENPADCASRGITANQLKDFSLWWRGPTWLAKNQENWPVHSPPVDEAFNLEARPGISLIAAIQLPIIQWDLVNRYSTLTRLLRITAIIIKFTSKLRQSPVTSPLSSITPADLEKAKVYWIKSTQAAYFNQDIRTLSNNQQLPPHHAFNRLTAYVDSEGVLRVGGRLQHANLTHDAKHQAILPRHSPFTNLIIRYYHHSTLHGGTQITLTTIRQRYWIMGGRAPVKTFILRCVECARQRGIRAQQLMGQLPQPRITPSRPFSHTGIDYAGPFIIKTWRGRGAKTRKAWVCVFVCMTTSAVHLEAVGDYSTDGFLAAYRRFTSRRGVCHTIYSDCGRNFIGADVELKRLFTQFTRENEVISRFIVDHGTKWTFNPPAAPHMGGKWESVVKSLKYHLTRTVKESLLTFEEITTLLTQIEAILNSRPLEPISDDPEDIQALTPGHFLTGSALNLVPEPTVAEPAISNQNRWQLIQRQSQQFWYRWSKSYLQKLQAISKWFYRNNDIQVGALALLTDERFPPSRWPLVRIVQLHPGQDGLSRVATIKTPTTTLIRPIVKLAILPINTTPDAQQQESPEDNQEEERDNHQPVADGGRNVEN